MVSGKGAAADRMYPHLVREGVASHARPESTACRTWSSPRSSACAGGNRRDCAERLIDTLLRLAIEHAGAELGVRYHSKAADYMTGGSDRRRGTVTVRLCDAQVGGHLAESVVRVARAGTRYPGRCLDVGHILPGSLHPPQRTPARSSALLLKQGLGG